MQKNDRLESDIQDLIHVRDSLAAWQNVGTNNSELRKRISELEEERLIGYQTVDFKDES